MEKEHEKEFIAWEGERERAKISGTIGAAAQGLDLYIKMKDKSKQAKDTISYVESQGGGDVKRKSRKGILGKMQKGLEDVFGGAKYEVSGGAMEEGEYTAGQLKGMSQFHAVEAMNDPDRAEETRKKYADKQEDWASTDVTGDPSIISPFEDKVKDLMGDAGDLMGDAGDYIGGKVEDFKGAVDIYKNPLKHIRSSFGSAYDPTQTSRYP